MRNKKYLLLAVFIVFLISVISSYQNLSSTSAIYKYFQANVPHGQRMSCPELYDGFFSSPVQYSDRESQITGHAFSGKVTRRFTENRTFESFKQRDHPKSSKSSENGPFCKRWAVVTTIFEPSEAVRRQVRLEGWCLVVIADKKSVKEYNPGWFPGRGNDAVVYLTPEEQEAMKIPFIDALPWNHFGRKNVGFLYAILHGAEIIWDFDDDNLLKFWLRGAAPPGAPSLDASIPGEHNCINGRMEALLPKEHNWPTYNPYPKLGAPTLPSWPRGIPLDDIKVAESFNTTLKDVSVGCSDIAVLQSLAEYQPDVDAVFRFTQPIPFWFLRSKEHRPLIVPTGVFTPYNAQATLHFSSGFFGLFLPVTVNGRVSDIWRSYFAQRLFWDIGAKIGFASRPLVVQDRNGHSYVKDLEGENDLYMKSKQLIMFLGQWKGRGATIVERTEELWIALYEREYIEKEDVMLVQRWLQFLVDVGYKFPAVKEKLDGVSVPTFPPPLNHSAFDLSADKDVDERTVDATCKYIPSLTFLTPDRHPGCRIDMSSALSTIGQSVIIVDSEIVPKNNPHFYDMKGITLYDRVSPALTSFDYSYGWNPRSIPESMIRDIFEFYKNDEKFTSVDAFLCTFPSSLCEVWMPFNKTIVLVPAHRYDLHRCSQAEHDRLNEHLYKLSSMGRLVLGAESKYDVEYLHYYTGLSALPLYSYSGFYTAGNPYSPTKESIIVFGVRDDNVAHRPNLAKDMNEIVKKYEIVDAYQLYPHWTFSDLAKHRAVIFIPYAVMTYKITEIYSLSIPMIFPSIAFIRDVLDGFGLDRTARGSYYCKTFPEVGERHPTSLHPYSPDKQASVDPEAEYYWVQFSDFYEWPHITYFDSYDQLEEILDNMNFSTIHEKMVEENKRRERVLKYNWCKVISKMKDMERGGFSKDYTTNIKSIYGVDRLQVN